MIAFWRRRSETCWLNLCPRYASCAKAMPTQRAATSAAIVTTACLTPSALVRTVPAATNALVLLMLRCGVRRCCEGAAYIKAPSARLPPAPFQLVGRDVAEVEPITAQARLGLGEALSETLARDAQRILGVHLQPARQRDDCEQQVAHLFEC